MKNRLTLQQRLILPIVLLGLVTLLSNILAVFSLNNVNSSAGTIVDEYMVSEARLEEIRHSMMNIHRLALSHIVAADHSTMIRLVGEIKAEENTLDERLESYRELVDQKELGTYENLLSDYASFKHALVRLVCASADSKTQEAYSMANGDVARYSTAAEESINALYRAVSDQATEARNHLLVVYLSSLVISVLTLIAGILLVIAAFRVIRRFVIAPIQDAMDTLQGSSQRIRDVVGEVRDRTQNSSKSVQALSSLTDQLSAAIEKIADSTNSISHSASGTLDDARTMAQECSAITTYSIDMRVRAEEIQQSAQTNMEIVRSRTQEIMSNLNKAIEKSQSVNQISILTKDILSISSSTDLIAINASIEATRAGEAGKGFAVVAQEIRRLADSCTETANHIQEVSGIVTGAVGYLTGSAQELVDYLGKAVLSQFEQSVKSGQQYRDDAVYIQNSIEAFNTRVERLKAAMDEIAGSISNISAAIGGAASDVTGAADSTHSLVGEIDGITARMRTNQEIVGELRNQVDVFANL